MWNEFWENVTQKIGGLQEGSRPGGRYSGGWTQGVALQLGTGRVAVLGDSGLLPAHLVGPSPSGCILPTDCCSRGRVSRSEALGLRLRLRVTMLDAQQNRESLREPPSSPRIGTAGGDPRVDPECAPDSPPCVRVPLRPSELHPHSRHVLISHLVG